MKIPTSEEIRKIFDPSKYSDFTVNISEDDDGAVCLKVSQMYSYVSCGIDQILGLCKLFETEDVSVGEQYHFNGCETCDYGSSYIVIFMVKNRPLSPQFLNWIENRKNDSTGQNTNQDK